MRETSPTGRDGDYFVQLRANGVPVQQRVGWLLRVNRMSGPAVRGRRLSTFVRDLSAAIGHDRVSPSTVSRWETGQSVIPYWAAAGYEKVLELHPGTITVTCDTIVRYLTPPTARMPRWAKRDEPPSSASLEQLVDRAVGGDVMTSADWDRISALIAPRPSLVFSPATTWDRLCERLLVEIAVADGVPWMARAEAYHRLIAHPVGQSHATAAALAAAADAGAQSMIGTLSVLNAAVHQDANTAVVGHIVDPVDHRTFYGALLTGSKKLRYGLLRPNQLAVLAPVLVELLSTNAEESGLAAALLAMLPAAVRARLPAGRLAEAETLLRPDRARSTQAICASVAPDDVVLARLVDEMLHDPVFDIRLCAMLLVYVTPYRARVARALAGELLRLLRNRTDPAQQRRILESLRVLGGVRERRLVEDILLRNDSTAELRDAAAYALGHITGTSTDTFYLRALRLHTTRWDRMRCAHDLSVLDRLVYALGMGDRDGVLHKVVTDDGAPRPIRAAATWWTTLPVVPRQSAKL